MYPAWLSLLPTSASRLWWEETGTGPVDAKQLANAASQSDLDLHSSSGLEISTNWTSLF